MNRIVSAAVALMLAVVTGLAVVLGVGQKEASARGSDWIAVDLWGATVYFSPDLSECEGSAYVEADSYVGGTGGNSSTFRVRIGSKWFGGYCYPSWTGNPNHNNIPAPSSGTYSFHGTRNSNGTYELIFYTSGSSGVAYWVVGGNWSGIARQDVVIPKATLNIKGTGKIKKTSTNNPVNTAGNSLYNFRGIQYGVYSDAACTQKVDTLQLDASGSSGQTKELIPATYYIKEIRNENTGYVTDTQAHAVKIEPAVKPKEWATSDAPIYGYVKIVKQSLSTGTNVLRSGFKFDLFDSKNNKVATATTDDTGTAIFKRLDNQSQNCPLPLGDYYAKETYAPEPYFFDGTTTYPVKIRQSGSMGAIQSGYNGANEGRDNVIDVVARNKQWGYLQAVKKNVATGGTVKNGEFHFNLYRAGDRSNVVATATIKPGTDGVAYFVEPGTNTPKRLVAVNSADASEGYYDIYEMSVTEPFYLTNEKVNVTITADGQKGKTSTIVKTPDGTGTVFKDGAPAGDSYTQAGQRIYVEGDAASQANWGDDNTAPIEFANDQYGFINVIKKNVELDRTGPTIAQAGFKFRLYYTEQDAVNETNWVEEIETDATGTKPFTTKLPVRRDARTDTGKPGTDAKRTRLSGEPDRNDGVYYVRESFAPVPYNKSNLIYRFTLDAADGQDGTEGRIKATIDIRYDTASRNSPYSNAWQAYWTVPNTGSTVSIHGDDRLSGANVPNVVDTTAENSPQYGRATILKTDSIDGSVQRGAEYQVYALQDITYTNQRDMTGTPTAGYDNVGADLQPFGYTKNHGEDVNSMSWPLRHAEMRDVSRTTKLKAGSSQFDEKTGKVTVDQSKAVTFMRADGTTYDTIVTDENGKATTGWLPIGASGSARYALVEVKTSNGHVIDGTPIVFTLSYDSHLNDRECIVSRETTQNNRDDQTQKDQPNGISVHKSVKPSTLNPEGGALEGVTIGFWKEEDDIKVDPVAADGTYAFDAVVIRTSEGADLVPTVHQRVTGSELFVEELDETLTATLVLDGHQNDPVTDDPTKDGVVTGGSEGIVVTDNKRIDITREGVADTVPTGTYEVLLTDTETGKRVNANGLKKVTLGEGLRTSLRIGRGAITNSPEVSMDADPIEIRSSNLRYEADKDAWVATNLKFGAEYEVEFNRKVVTVIHTSETGGRTWFGRFSYAETPWFHNGWLDQAALPTSDSKIILQSHMNVAEGEDKFSTNKIATKDNHMWLQDTVDTRTYGLDSVVDRDGNAMMGYQTVTGKDGSFTNLRIGAGKYVIAEIKPPVNETLHQTYLPDLRPHYFEVDDVTGYVLDTDDQVSRADRKDYNYDAAHHTDDSHIVTKTKDFLFEDDVTKLRLSKREVADGEELLGAELVLTADNNDVIDRWTSGEEPHYIENLVPGWYRLTEYATPKNYDKAETIEFNLLPTGEVQHTIMLDAPIYIDAEIDKIQEIATPLGTEDRPNGDGRNHADAQPNDNGLYSYSLDFRSNSNTWTDEFTVEDPMEPATDGYARLLSVVTPQAFQDYDGKMNVWFRTNKTPTDYRDLESEVPTKAIESAEEDAEADADAEPVPSTPKSRKERAEREAAEAAAKANQPSTKTEQPLWTYKANATYDDGHDNPWLADDDAMAADEDRDWRIIGYEGWRLWEKDVPTAVSETLYVSDLELDEDEYVTGIRFEYGRVEVGFTTRVDGGEWVRENLKYEHDDSNQITGLSTQSFLSNDHAADAAIARMRILTTRFTTDMSFMVEDAAARAREQAKKDYDLKLISIDEYNRLIADLDNAPLPKFAEALVAPAYTDDADDTRRLDAATEAAKASLQAAFPLATTDETRDRLLTAARQATIDLEAVASQETIDNLVAKADAYETEIARLASESGGYDIDKATQDLLDAFFLAVDDLRTFGLSGRVPYAPAVLHMQLTEEFVPGVVMRNSARVDAYRNGGNGKDDDVDGQHNLDGHDDDAVVQTVRRKDDVYIGTRLATIDGQKIVSADGSESVELIDVVEYHNLEPGRRYQVDGTLHVRSYDSKAKTPVDGGPIKGSGGSTVFTPEQPDGTVEVKLLMPASETLWRPVVAYEEIREVDKRSGVASDVVLAEHKDITNEDQTVNVTMPADDVIDVAPIIQTGDKMAIATIASLAATVGLGTATYAVKRRRQHDA